MIRALRFKRFSLNNKTFNTPPCKYGNKKVRNITTTSANGESPKKKRRRVDSANIKLLDSHRVYCPYVSGFASGNGNQSEPGWKVVLSKLQ